MRPSVVLACVVTAAGAAAMRPSLAHAQADSPLAGVWTLNRSLSEFRSDIGFNVNWVPTPGSDGQSSSAGGRGRRGSTGGGGNRGPAPQFSGLRESSEDARRRQLLTAEVRNPPTRLTVVDTPAAVTMTNELGQSRVLHPDGRQESIDVQGVTVSVSTKRDGDRLVVVYHVEQDRDLRYTFSHGANPSQFIVDVQFLEKGPGDKARRVYDAGVSTETSRAPATGADPALASSSRQTPETFDQRPGAELIGLTSLGIVVEDLSAQAIACGLNHDSLEATLSKRLTDGGFAVRRNSDEDTYVYVNVMTNSLSDGMCVSRYDAFLYTHATAKLSYRDKSVLVQVSLMHRGGIGSSAPSAHAAAVGRGLLSYIDLFVTQVHDANK
jgi:hypothetical protein